MEIIYIVIGVIVLVLLWVAFAYNRFVSLINRAKEAWSDIDVQLKRRYDLIPNLVSTVKGYATHESSAFEKVTTARAAAMGAGASPAAKGQAENMLTGALKSLFAVAEAYPDLKANQSALQLQEEIVSTENKLAYAKQAFNDSIERYNATKKSFFQSMVVSAFRSKLDFDFPYWQLTDDQVKTQENYTVKL